MSTPLEQTIAAAVLADAPFRQLVANYKAKLDEIDGYNFSITNLQNALTATQANLAAANTALESLATDMSTQLAALVKTHLP